MFANNEIGTIAPIKEIGTIAHQHGVIFHTDAAQAVGHISVDVEELNIDLLSFSAHKVYGPKGIAGLYVRRRNPRVKVAPVIYGGGHELGVRSGTLNVPGIVGMGQAMEIAEKEMKSEGERYLNWTQQIFAQLSQAVGDIELNGHPIRRLPHNLNISIKGIESKSLVVQLKNIAISTGSACTSATVEPSHVIMALGFGEDRAHSAIRIGVGRDNSSSIVPVVSQTIAKAVKRLRSFQQV
jgi:cysteine desulfurase